MLSRDEYREIYKMFDRVSPFPYDCGKRCNSICCRADAFPESLPDKTEIRERPVWAADGGLKRFRKRADLNG